MTVIPESLVLPLATRHGVTAEEARNALEWARSMPATMDYPQEARRAADGGGDLDLVWRAWVQHQLDERAALMRQATRTNDFAGTPRVWHTCQAFLLRLGPTIDGKTWHHFRDDKGRWLRYMGPELTPLGSRVKIRGRVKAHEEYRGARVTVLTRVEVLVAD